MRTGTAWHPALQRGTCISCNVPVPRELPACSSAVLPAPAGQGTWAPHAAAPVLRDVLVEAGHYVETALPFLCQNRLLSSTAALVQRRAPANSPELAHLCAADNLNLDNLAVEGWEPVALVNLWAQKSVEIVGMTWWCPEHLLERVGG